MVRERVEQELLPRLDEKTVNIDHFARKRYVLIMPAVEFTAEPDEKPVAGPHAKKWAKLTSATQWQNDAGGKSF